MEPARYGITGAIRYAVLALPGLLALSFGSEAHADDARIGVARALIAERRCVEARTVLLDVIRGPAAAPAEAYYHLAVCEARQGRAESAETNLKTALEMDPMHLPSMHLKAYLRFGDGDYEESIRWASKLLEANPSGGETRTILGLARFMSGDIEGAELDLQQAVATLPSNFDAHYYLARVYFERSKLSPALESFRKAVAIRPDSVKAHNQLGQTLEGLTRFDEAAAAYRTAVEYESTGVERSEWPYYNLGSLLLSGGEPERAVRYLEQALERNPSSVQTMTRLAVALSAASRPDEAATALRAAVRAAPGNAEAHFQLGRVLQKLGKPDDARRHLDQFEKLREQ